MVRNRIFAIVALGLFVGSFSSCEKEIEYEGEATESLLVINQLIEKDSTFSIEIERSVFFLENTLTGNTQIDDAEVTLKNLTTGSSETLSSGLYGVYDFSQNANSGHQYEVTVYKADYPEAKAQTVIPSTIPFISVDTSTFIYPEDQSSRMRSTLKWNDPVGKNYYILTVSTDQLGGGEARISLNSTDLSIINGDAIDGLSSGSMFALDDDFFDGTQKELRIDFRTPPTIDTEGINFRLYNCTEDTYRYLVSAERELISGGDFLSEPVRVHTNVIDGYGIFAGYAKDNFHVSF